MLCTAQKYERSLKQTRQNRSSPRAWPSACRQSRRSRTRATTRGSGARRTRPATAALTRLLGPRRESRLLKNRLKNSLKSAPRFAWTLAHLPPRTPAFLKTLLKTLWSVSRRLWERNDSMSASRWVRRLSQTGIKRRTSFRSSRRRRVSARETTARWWSKRALRRGSAFRRGSFPAGWRTAAMPLRCCTSPSNLCGIERSTIL
mmetsp:Transcript_26603/g.89535  ORF Transcript_26603/g.89535 Transcript_26603/m.89535 type:complete len:203 (-) Transcript_26603:137-745(-)